MSTVNQGNGAMVKYTAIGTVLQIAMVVGGHYNEFIRMNVFALGGMAISMLFGALWAKSAATSKGGGFGGGALVGGLCAIIGIAVSVILGDTEAAVLAFGTLGSAVMGGLGGLAVFAISGKRSVATA